MTAVGGVRRDKDDPASRIGRLTVAEARAAIAEGVVQGGMIPKLEEAFAPLAAGVGRVQIVAPERSRRRCARRGQWARCSRPEVESAPMGRLQNHLQRKFLAGILAAVPLAVTAFILWYVDAHLRDLVGVRIPFVGIPAALAALYLLGVFVTSLIGRYLLRAVDWTLNRLPGFKDLYRSWKQIAVSPDVDAGILAKVVLIPDESGKIRMLGFTSGRPIEGSEDTLCVFVPASPNPATGRLYFVRVHKYLFLPVGTKDALKFIVSGGNYVPPSIGVALPRS